MIGVLQAERIPDAVRGRVLSLQNACLQIAAPAGIGLAGVVAEHDSPLAAALTLTAAWLAVVIAFALSRALVDVALPGEVDLPGTSMDRPALVAE